MPTCAGQAGAGVALVNDALAVLAAVADPRVGPRAGRGGRAADAGGRPRRRGGRAVVAGARRVAPDRVISTVDPEARHTRNSGAAKRDGYKGHLAAEPETGLVTECALTAATTADGPTGVGLLAGEEPGLEVLGDTGYGSGQTARRCAPPAIPRRSSRSRCRARCGRVHHSRLPDRPASRHGHLPSRRHDQDHRVRAGQLGCWCLALPARMEPGCWPEIGCHRAQPAPDPGAYRASKRPANRLPASAATAETTVLTGPDGSRCHLGRSGWRCSDAAAPKNGSPREWPSVRSQMCRIQADRLIERRDPPDHHQPGL
jgi:hypothetical protein